MASLQVNLLIQEVFNDPDRFAAFKADRKAVYDRYGLTEAERVAVDEGGREALSGAGMHPIIQMSHFIGTNPAATDFVSIKAYYPMVARDG